MRSRLPSARQSGSIRATAEGFARYPNAFTDVAIGEPGRDHLDEPLPNVRVSADLGSESPDAIVIAASAVPPREREELVRQRAPIEKFWDLERRHNFLLMRGLLSWLGEAGWRILIVATNPVQEWVNALDQIFTGRPIVGLGTAFDDRRIRLLVRAMSPKENMTAVRALRIVGGHGTAMVLGADRQDPGVVAAAKWMSDALSVDLVTAPDEVAKVWWTTVSLHPFVEGLSGVETRTHVVAPVIFDGVRAATGTDVVVNGLDIHPVPLKSLSREEHGALLCHLCEARENGVALADRLKRSEAETIAAI